MQRIWRDKRLRTSAIMIVFVLALFTVALVLIWPHIGLLRDQEALAARVGDAGALAPVVFSGLQMLQVIIAPIPGQVTGFVGGYLFGPWLGTLYSMIGTTLGFAIVFTLSRKLGRPFVELFVKEQHLQRIDMLASRRGAWLLLILFLLPSPDAALGYVSGLTKIPIRVLLVVSFLGRLPGIFVVCLAGSAVSESNYVLVGIVVAITILFGAIAYWQRARINTWLDRMNTPAEQ